MLILVGGVKVDLFPGDLASVPLGPWIADGSNLARMDQHFWDWTIWLAGKQLAARHELVSAELEKLHANLLGPLGSDKPPSPVGGAVETYRARRRANEQACGTRVDRLLGETISRRLRDNNVV